jgi:hypothetical protein
MQHVNKRLDASLIFSFNTRLRYGPIAQSVEQRIENPCVAGSIPARATIIRFNKKALQKCRAFLLLKKILFTLYDCLLANFYELNNGFFLTTSYFN